MAAAAVVAGELNKDPFFLWNAIVASSQFPKPSAR
jgi:hypothetical protein